MKKNSDDMYACIQMSRGVLFLLDVFGVQPNSESRVAVCDGKPRSGEGRANWLNK